MQFLSGREFIDGEHYMTTAELAEVLGVDPKLVTAWEAGRYIQTVHLDILMRIVFS